MLYYVYILKKEKAMKERNVIHASQIGLPRFADSSPQCRCVTFFSVNRINVICDIPFIHTTFVLFLAFLDVCVFVFLKEICQGPDPAGHGVWPFEPAGAGLLWPDFHGFR